MDRVLRSAPAMGAVMLALAACLMALVVPCVCMPGGTHAASHACCCASTVAHGMPACSRAAGHCGMAQSPTSRCAKVAPARAVLPSAPSAPSAARGVDHLIDAGGPAAASSLAVLSSPPAARLTRAAAPGDSPPLGLRLARIENLRI